MSSRLDYAILCSYHLELRRLQLVQNSLCSVVPYSSKFSHITPQLKKLYWLPVRYRVQFKTGLIIYKILSHGQPAYLSELIHPHTSSRNVRSSTSKLEFLRTPTFDCRIHKSNKHFSNSFTHYAPVLQNSFPFQIKNSPICLILQETPQNPPVQLQFPNLVSFPFDHTHNSGSLTLTAPQMSL